MPDAPHAPIAQRSRRHCKAKPCRGRPQARLTAPVSIWWRVLDALARRSPIAGEAAVLQAGWRKVRRGGQAIYCGQPPGKQTRAKTR
jgi:hypothetical protein